MSWWRRRRNRQLDDELQSHLDLAVAERVARGEDRHAAEVAARRELGNVGLIKSAVRRRWFFHSLDIGVEEIRFAIRRLRTASTYTTVTAASLAIAIAVVASAFGVIDRLDYRDLPFP